MYILAEKLKNMVVKNDYEVKQNGHEQNYYAG